MLGTGEPSIEKCAVGDEELHERTNPKPLRYEWTKLGMNYPKGGYRGYGRGGRDGWRFSTIRSSRQETRGITESKSGCRNDSPYTVTEVVFSPRIVLHIPWEGPSTLFKLFSVLNPFGVSCQVGMTRLLSLYVIVGIRTTPYLPHQGL